MKENFSKRVDQAPGNRGQAAELSPKEKLRRLYIGLPFEDKDLVRLCKLEFKSFGLKGSQIEGLTEDGKKISVKYEHDAKTLQGGYSGTIDGQVITKTQAVDLYSKYNMVAAFQTLAETLKGDEEARKYLEEIGLNL